MSKQPDKINTGIIVSALKKESTRLISKIDGFKIKDAASYQQLVDYVKVLKELEKRANDKRKSITDHLNKAVKEINSLFNPFFENIHESVQGAKDEMLKFENKRNEAEKNLEDKFSKGGVSVASFATKQAAITTKIKGASVRKTMTLKILDEKKIPRSYLVPNELMIMADLKEGKKVPGCDLEQKTSIAV